MKEHGVHEGPIEQIYALIAQQIYGGEQQLDNEGRYRVDLKELADTIQNEVEALWDKVDTENLHELSDFSGYQAEFYQLFGFGF